MTSPALLCLREQLPRPVDCTAKASLPRREVAWAAGEEIESFVEPREQLTWSEELGACGSELDGQRISVETSYKLDDDVYLRLVGGETTARAHGALDE